MPLRAPSFLSKVSGRSPRPQRRLSPGSDSAPLLSYNTQGRGSDGYTSRPLPARFFSLFRVNGGLS